MMIRLLLLLLLLVSSQLLLTTKAQKGGSSSSSQQLRATTTTTKCDGLSDSDCKTASDCSWCKCKAVPSRCVTNEQASRLPPAIWSCDDESFNNRSSNVGNASTSDPSNTSSSSSDDSQQIRRSVYQFGGLSVSLSSNDVDPQFCDPDSPKSLAGYVDLTGSKFDTHNENKHYFYWFFEARHHQRHEAVTAAADNNDAKPLILWLTGGPGCSSTLALLTENGPCSVNNDGTATKQNPFSWNNDAHIVYLDQPAGVGYSYGETDDKNEEMVAEDAYFFLQAFFKEYPQYLKSEFFVVGESYGGHYAPAIAHRVMEGNNQAIVNDQEDLVHINLAGVAVGNGLTDPSIQYEYYPEMAYNNSHGIKCVDEATYSKMKGSVKNCKYLIDQCNQGGFADEFKCQVAFAFCNSQITMPYYETGLNPYDIRLKCGSNPLCYDFSNVENFLNSDDTKQQLHISEASNKWVTCNTSVNGKFRADFMKDFAGAVADMLNNNIPILIYAGDVDFICNYMGNHAWTLALEWNHRDDFQNATEGDWGNGSGLVRSAAGFTFLQVYNAGHMVPSDQPEVALKMINEFITNKKL